MDTKLKRPIFDSYRLGCHVCSATKVIVTISHIFASVTSRNENTLGGKQAHHVTHWPVVVHWLVSCWGPRKRTSAPPYGLKWLADSGGSRNYEKGRKEDL